MVALGDEEGWVPRVAWWRYTAISAGATALVCALGFTFAGDPKPAAAAAARETEPVVVAYDPATLEIEETVEVGAPQGDEQSEALLARRIALRGTRNLDAGRTRLARDAFEEALGHDPDCRPALAGLGRIEFAAQRYRKAAELLGAAVHLEPRDAELQAMLAKSYRAIGHDRSAARHERLAAHHAR